MIFSCPNCEKKYILSGSALGPEGKMVRCANCYHEWFQEPEQQAYQEPEIEEQIEEYYEEETPAEIEAFEEEPDELQDGFDELDERIGAFLDEDENSNEEEAEEEQDEEEQALEDLIKEISEKSQQDEEAEEEYDAGEVSDELAIPQGVKPISDDEEEAPKEKKKRKPVREKVEEPMAARFMGMMAAVPVFACLFIFGIIEKPQIVSAWAPAAAIYDLAGIPVQMEGEGLVIEALSAELSKDGRKLHLKGSVVNLTDRAIAIPSMRASFKIAENKGKPWIIEPPQAEVAAKDTVKFDSTYQYPPEDVSMLNVTFVSKMK
ncbi:MAG: zinc-ribbon domain-containing protein [Pseudomonadota bacterium]